MKVLIWFLCIVVASMIPILFSYGDVILGGIPTLLLWCGIFWLAKTLCKKWDDHKSKKVLTHLANPSVYTGAGTKHIENNNKISFCRKCGERLIPDSRFCSKCGTEVAEVESAVQNAEECQMCKNHVGHLTYCEVTDDYGTKHRLICDECISKYNAKPKN